MTNLPEPMRHVTVTVVLDGDEFKADGIYLLPVLGYFRNPNQSNSRYEHAWLPVVISRHDGAYALEEREAEAYVRSCGDGSWDVGLGVWPASDATADAALAEAIRRVKQRMVAVAAVAEAEVR